MSKIDTIDKKIIYHLYIDSRQSLASIEKKIKVKKNVISYRINRLQKLGIIKNYFTIINPFTLGYSSYGFYLIYQYVTPDIRKKIIDYFITQKNTWFVASIEGTFDLGVSLWIKNLEEFYHFWKNTLENFRHYIKNHKFINYVQTRGYPPSYLLSPELRTTPREIIYIGNAPLFTVDTLDIQILKVLSTNARIPATLLAQQLQTSPTVVSYRIKKLEASQVIQNYTLSLDIAKIGYSDFRIDIDLIDYTHRDSLLEYILKNPALTYIFTSIGHSDIQFNVRVFGIDDVHAIMNDLCTQFPQSIRDYQYIHIPKIYKQSYMPLP
jgi:DNA-binding Lrp family transcriptional regulator